MLSEGLENIPCFIILPDVPKQFEGYASHEACRRMAAFFSQLAIHIPDPRAARPVAERR